MKKKSILLAATAVMLVCAMSIGGMLAYFTDTDTKENTFTVGKVEITLTEPKWDEAAAEEFNKLIPTRTIPKDPTITVAEGSQTAYTFMKVELSEDFADLLQAYATKMKITDPNVLIDAWFTSEVKPKVMEMNLDNRYVVLGVLSPKKAGESVTYFDEVKVPGDVTGDMIDYVNGVYTITITAYAIQAEGFYDETDKQASRQAAYEALRPEIIGVAAEP